MDEQEEDFLWFEAYNERPSKEERVLALLDGAITNLQDAQEMVSGDMVEHSFALKLISAKLFLMGAGQLATGHKQKEIVG